MDSLKRDPTILTRLTPREYEIIQLIGKGMDNQEIAETGIAQITPKSNVVITIAE